MKQQTGGGICMITMVLIPTYDLRFCKMIIQAVSLLSILNHVPWAEPWLGGDFNYFFFTPKIGGNDPIWLPFRELTYPIKKITFEDDFPFPFWWDMLIPWRVVFFKWVGSTTNQMRCLCFFSPRFSHSFLQSGVCHSFLFSDPSKRCATTLGWEWGHLHPQSWNLGILESWNLPSWTQVFQGGILESLSLKEP